VRPCSRANQTTAPHRYCHPRLHAARLRSLRTCGPAELRTALCRNWDRVAQGHLGVVREPVKIGLLARSLPGWTRTRARCDRDRRDWFEACSGSGRSRDRPPTRIRISLQSARQRPRHPRISGGRCADSVSGATRDPANGCGRASYVRCVGLSSRRWNRFSSRRFDGFRQPSGWARAGALRSTLRPRSKISAAAHRDNLVRRPWG
jgi:hypothetical protein